MSKGKIEHTVTQAGQGPNAVHVETYAQNVATGQDAYQYRDTITTNREGRTTETLSVNEQQAGAAAMLGVRGKQIVGLTLKDGHLTAYDGHPASELSATQRAQAAALETEIQQALGKHSIQATPMPAVFEHRSSPVTPTPTGAPHHSGHKL